jgi:hypothetical protein
MSITVTSRGVDGTRADPGPDTWFDPGATGSTPSIWLVMVASRRFAVLRVVGRAVLAARAKSDP